MYKQTKGCILLLLCAMIWGAAFVAQSEGMQYVGPFTMGATRFFLAGLVLLPVIRVLDRKGWSQNRPVTKEDKKRQLAAGAICGVLLFAATTLQQFGLLDTTVGKSGFVTALYIVFVPIVGVLTGKKAGLRVWLCAAAAVFGMYLLCVGWRSADARVRGALYVPYLLYQRRLAADGRRAAELRTVFCVLGPVGDRHVRVRVAGLGFDPQLLAADRVRGRVLRRRGLYLPDHRRTGRAARAGVAADEPGIGLRGAVRLDPHRAGSFRAGADRVRDHVRGHPPVAAAGAAEESRLIHNRNAKASPCRAPRGKGWRHFRRK